MGQNLCRLEEKTRDTVCDFKEYWIIAEIFSEDRDNWIPFAIHSVSLLLLLVVWFLSFRPRRADFSRSFVMTTLVLLTVLTVCRWLLALNEKLQFICKEYRCMEENNVFAVYLQLLVTFPESFLRPSTYVYLSLSTMFFLFMVLMMAKSKEPKTGTKAWVPFIAALLLSVLLSSSIQFVDFSSSYEIVHNIPKGLHFILFNCSIFIITIFCQRFSCFSTSQREEEADGVSSLTEYKRSLRLSAIFFALFALVPLFGHLIITDFFSTLGQYVGAPSSKWLPHTESLLEYLTPIFFCLATIAFLPRYRLCVKTDRSEDYKDE